MFTILPIQLHILKKHLFFEVKENWNARSLFCLFIYLLRGRLPLPQCFMLFIFICSTFNIILHWFQVHSIVVRQPYTLQSVPQYFHCSLGTPHSIEYVLCIECYWVYWAYFPCYTLHPCIYSVTTNFYFLIPLPFSPSPPKPPPLWGPPVCSLYPCICFCCLCLYCSLDSTCEEIIWYLSFSDWLISFSLIPSRYIHAVAKGKILIDQELPKRRWKRPGTESPEGLC